ARAALDELERLGASGLRVAQAHAINARIAAATGEPGLAARHASACLAQFSADADRKIVARFSALVDAGSRPTQPVTRRPPLTASTSDAVISTITLTE
ncbi:MAG TPA: hypothetical protein VHZ95_08020, partial [Polyangiales bacterium]|nr:hypothetical protein [Polyangiales bacterium]